jgi:hypothetical protein
VQSPASIRNSASGTLFYDITDDADWLAVNPASGDSSGESDDIDVHYTPAALPPGTHAATITITAIDAHNSPQFVEVSFNVTPNLGDFDGDGDIDMIDFGHIQTCLDQSGLPQNAPECIDTRLDTDNDVDQQDLAIFLNCLSGAGVLGDPACSG